MKLPQETKGKKFPQETEGFNMSNSIKSRANRLKSPLEIKPWFQMESRLNTYSEVAPKFKFLLQAIKMKTKNYLNLKNIERRYKNGLRKRNYYC